MEQRLSDYVLERELAKGGMGTVFLGRHATLGRPVAIKLLQANSAKHLRRFQTEAVALARLQHPNIVAVHEVQLEGPTPFLVMAYVEGDSLEARIGRQGPLAPEEAARLGLDLARALAHAHGHGILHRDIKPANVLLGPEGPLLADFGLARELSEERERLTLTGQLVGTPAYMPPEQAVGEHSSVGEPSDVYGLGATLYHALSGEPPFSGGSLMNVIAAVTRAAPTPLPVLRSDVPAPLAAIVARCLAKAPGDRYSDATALADDLERFLSGEAISRAPRSHRRWAIAGAAAAVIALGAYALRPVDPAPTPAPTPTVAATTPTPPPAAAVAEFEGLKGRRFLLKVRPWLAANPDHPKARDLRLRYLQTGLTHPLLLQPPRGVQIRKAWYVPILVGRKTVTQVLTVAPEVMSFHLWDLRTREWLRTYGRSDYRGQLRYDRARNAAKAIDPSGQAHEWLLLMLDFEHNRWFVRDPERKGRAWTERPARWTASPKKSHMTFAYDKGEVEVYEEHEHTLLARLPHPGQVDGLKWTADERYLVTIGASRKNKMAGFVRTWDLKRSVLEPEHITTGGRPMAMVLHPTQPLVLVAIDYRIEVRRLETLELLSTLSAPGTTVLGLKGNQAHTARIRRMVFSRDGSRLYSFALRSGDGILGDRYGELRAWDCSEGGEFRFRAVVKHRQLDLNSLDMSPSGHQLLAVSGSSRERRQLALYDVAVPRPK